MRDYHTFADMEALLLISLKMPGRSTKDVGTATGIKTNTLYKWKTADVHLSPAKADALLLYFMKNEPQRLQLAETVLTAKLI